MRKLGLVVLCLAAATANASQIRDFYILPVAAHVSGASGTSWRTDVSIQNIQSTPLTIEMSVVESGEGLLDNIFPVAGTSVTIPPGGSMILNDVLRNHRGRAETSGALLVGGNRPFALTSRTYNQTSNGTLGQTVSPATDVASDGSAATSTLFLPGLIANGAFRTNIGLVMSATTALVVTVTINAADGHALGTRTFGVPAGATTHVQFATTSVTAAPFDAASATVRITNGSGTVVAYASIVDNVTGDGSYVAAGTASAGQVTSLQSLLRRSQ